MELPKIKNLEKLLSTYLGQAKFITDLETTRLTATGENYGSQMLALKIHVDNKTHQLVAKIPPPGEFMQRMFNIPVTFRNEVDFYNIIIPHFEDFLTEKGLNNFLDCFPKFFGARLSLTQNNKVDDDAVLILENLKIEGYVMQDRTIGFDYPTSRVVIKALAKYHAVPLALKFQKPEVFAKIRALFSPYKVFEFDDAACDLMVERFKKMVDEIPSCRQYSQRVVNAIKPVIQVVKNDAKFIREPFATVIHTDAWVNNFMVKYQDGSTPVGCKIVDFQLGEYGSPLRDVIFFLYTSVQVPVIREHYNDLIGLYHQSLVDILGKCGCDVGQFSKEALDEEIEAVVREFEFCHCILMLNPIFATKDEIKELDEYTDEDMTKETPIPPKMKEKAEFIIQDFVNRNWI